MTRRARFTPPPSAAKATPRARRAVRRLSPRMTTGARSERARRPQAPAKQTITVSAGIAARLGSKGLTTELLDGIVSRHLRDIASLGLNLPHATEFCIVVVTTRPGRTHVLFGTEYAELGRMMG